MSSLDIKGISALELLSLPNSYREEIFEYVGNVRKQVIDKTMEEYNVEKNNKPSTSVYDQRLNPNNIFKNKK